MGFIQEALYPRKDISHASGIDVRVYCTSYLYLLVCGSIAKKLYSVIPLTGTTNCRYTGSMRWREHSNACRER